MNRRQLIGLFAAGAVKSLRGLTIPKIKDVQVIATAPANLRLTVVKIVTDQDGLYGYGCGTYTQRADLVNLAGSRTPGRRCTTRRIGATVRR
jgi:mannonate dehydratase